MPAVSATARSSRAVAGEVPGHDGACGVIRSTPVQRDQVTWGWKVPSPLPSRTLTPLPFEAELATARSSRPSPLKSPATIASGPGPTDVGDLGLEGAVAIAQQHRDRVAAECWRRPGRACRRR